MSFAISTFDIVEEMAFFGVLNTFGVSKGMWYSVLDLGHTMGLKPFWNLQENLEFMLEC